MGRRSDYKKDPAWTAWDMNCRRICPVDSTQRRKLRDVLRRRSRKWINRMALKEGGDAMQYGNAETASSRASEVRDYHPMQ